MPSRRRKGEKKRRPSEKQEDPIKPPSRPHAGGKASRHAFYYYEITVRSLRGRCREGSREKLRPTRYTSDNQCPNRARPLKRGGRTPRVSFRRLSRERTCLSSRAVMALYNYSSLLLCKSATHIHVRTSLPDTTNQTLELLSICVRTHVF